MTNRDPRTTARALWPHPFDEVIMKQEMVPVIPVRGPRSMELGSGKVAVGFHS